MQNSQKSIDLGPTKDEERCTMLRVVVVASLISVNGSFSACLVSNTHTICGSEAWPRPQFFRGVVCPQAAYPVALADTARDTLRPAIAGALTGTMSQTITRAFSRTMSRTTSRAMCGTVPRAMACAVCGAVCYSVTDAVTDTLQYTVNDTLAGTF
jgi:hypothetical protein